MKQRPDDFIQRSEHLKSYTDLELKAYFFKLIDDIVDPLLEIAYTHTTPAIERSVLMRMGFSSTEAKAITNLFFEHNLLSFGAGHVVYRFAKDFNLSIREAGLRLLETDDILKLKEVFIHD
jgi:D-ornithine 4,5-aminomutase subunit alpha